MDEFLYFAAAVAVLAALWIGGRSLQKRERRAAQKSVSMKLKDGAPPEDVYPMW